MPEGNEEQTGTAGGTTRGTGSSGSETDTSEGDTGTSSSETRWEVGFFVRRTTTQSSSPPDYPDKPDM